MVNVGCVSSISSPADLPEMGYWRGSYASDLLIRSDESGQPVLSLAGANQIVTLRYDPAMPPVLPPMPQSPEPLSGQTEAPLSLALSWGPPTDPCDPLTYDAYFSQGDNPAYLAQVSGRPFLEVPELAPTAGALRPSTGREIAWLAHCGASQQWLPNSRTLCLQRRQPS